MHDSFTKKDSFTMAPIFHIFIGVGGYCICYARMETPGANIQSDPEIVTMTQSSQGANVSKN